MNEFFIKDLYKIHLFEYYETIQKLLDKMPKFVDNVDVKLGGITIKARLPFKTSKRKYIKNKANKITHVINIYGK